MEVGAEIINGGAEIAEFPLFDTVRLFHPAIATTAEVTGLSLEDAEAIFKVFPEQPVF